mmetsp:Transcript_23224/g.37836  ORF Transcript_23224/g.37836 Transcript_23224/m.37836 type:complete len:368 (-) Transcript_23224:383-1486(-)
MTMTNENEKDPRRLTVVLNDPNAEWRDIRSAMSMRAKTSVLGCSTNLAIINSSCSGGVGPDGKRSNLILAAADYVEAAEGSWEASAESSNRRPSRRSSRCASRKRCSLRSSRSSAADSVNMLDFGVSQHLAMLDESNRSSVPDESRRRCAALDELFEIENSGEESERSLETRSEADLDDVDSHGFMNYWPLTPREEVDDGGKEKETIAGTNGTTLDQMIGAEEGKTSHTSQESYNNRRASRSRRSVHRHSTRRSSRQGSLRWSGRSRSSASSLGSSNFSDSLISESGFMAWPSAAQEDVKREEEEWNIEDYEKNVDNLDRNDLRLSEGSSGPDPSAFVNTLYTYLLECPVGMPQMHCLVLVTMARLT